MDDPAPLEADEAYDEVLSPASSQRQKELMDRLDAMMLMSEKELQFSEIAFGAKNPAPPPPMLRSGGNDSGASETDSNEQKRYKLMRKIPQSMWTVEQTVGGWAAAQFSTPEDRIGSVADGIDEFKANPTKYVMIEFNVTQLQEPEPRPPHAQFYRLWPRRGMEGLEMHPNESTSNTVLWNTYQHLPSVSDFNDVDDGHIDGMSYQGNICHSEDNKPICPGRGQGLLDYRVDLTIIRDVDPCDVHQGQVGDCWLLSAISALAEFDGAVHKLFANTEGDLKEMPTRTPNQYVVTLYDLATWEPVDITIDERLAANPSHPGTLLGAKPSEDGELWVPYLEKAFSIHCGGWDHIDGGLCYHAWAMLTGCREQYMFRTFNEGKTFVCERPFNPDTNELEAHHNSSLEQHKVPIWENPWPEVGGGGERGTEINKDAFFKKMCAWDTANYIFGAGTYGESDGDNNNGLVDCHAYAVLRSISNVANSGVDLVQVRNPWGNGEMEKGRWNDHGPGWADFPAVKGYLDPVFKDDGLFWMSKEEFFTYFNHFLLCAKSMK